ncbi:hypothetical protein ACFFMN_40580 [Planobispora siamensis]|uniref:Uncharacterized protein n=1 Tax=Planobispora siamensis TaxID=936338 RepID=A0A8J3SSJ3_9ACTN|nr:hypothetical protein [Planobispora siamensis]GIH97614.1 hypothetical protein Psi01_82440 [Planobispora siamensis]
MPVRTIRAVPESEALRRVGEIAARRARCHDPDLETLSDEPLEAVAYVLERRRVPEAVLRCDVTDALVLLEYVRRAVPALPGRLDRLEYRLLSLGVELGLSLGELAAALGLRSRQAVQHRLLRHAAAERGAPRSEVAERTARRAESRERAWLDRNAPALLECTRRLLGHRDLLSPPAADPGAAGSVTGGGAGHGAGEDAVRELAEAFDELAESLARVPADRRDPAHTTRVRHLAARLRLLLADLRAHPAAGLRARPAVRDLLERTARLAAAHQAASSGDR